MTGYLISRGGEFKPPADGWVQVLAIGDFPNAEAGIVQHVDQEALDAIIADFKTQSSTDNWPGLLVDFDHFSHSKDHATAGAAWIDSIDQREDQLWAHWRLTDAGSRAVSGGDYRLTSPVLAGFVPYDGAPSDKHLRPTKLVRVALTNDPNIKGMAPVSNRQPTEHGDTTMADEVENKTAVTANHKKLLCELIGLTEEASDEDIQKAIDLLKADAEADGGPNPDNDGDEATHPAELAGNREVEALTQQLVALNRELAATKAEKHFVLVGEDAKVREALVALMAENRANAELVFGAITAKAKEVEIQAANRNTASGASRFQPTRPAFDSSVQHTPGGDQSQSVADDAVKTRLKASEIQAANRGMSWGQAWSMAERQVKPENGSAVK